MKASFYSIIFILFFCNFSLAQKTERIGKFYNSPDIQTTGDVKILQNKKGHLIIKFSGNFATQEGPDLDIYLGTTEKVGEGEHLKIEHLYNLEGSQKYVSDSKIDIDKYSYVIIHCTKWNHWYGSAKLE